MEYLNVFMHNNQKQLYPFHKYSESVCSMLGKYGYGAQCAAARWCDWSHYLLFKEEWGNVCFGDAPHPSMWFDIIIFDNRGFDFVNAGNLSWTSLEEQLHD